MPCRHHRQRRTCGGTLSQGREEMLQRSALRLFLNRLRITLRALWLPSIAKYSMIYACSSALIRAESVASCGALGALLPAEEGPVAGGTAAHATTAELRLPRYAQPPVARGGLRQSSGE